MGCRILVICITIICHVLCDARVLNVLEGEIAKMDFPYPCDSTKITLQHSYRPPFYNSNNPGSVPFPPHYLLENQHDSARNECSLHLTIDPVSRDDEGTYILMAYKNGVMLPDYPRIGLRVDYPPGKASCEISNDYGNDGEWVSLRCTAPVGTLSGQIICYYEQRRLPSLTLPEENGKTLNQIILARLVGLAYCCSSTLGQTKDQCECNDFIWNTGTMIENTEFINIPDPCAVVVHRAEQDSTNTSKDHSENSTTHPTTSFSKEPGKRCSSDYWLYAIIIATCIIVLATCSIALFYYFRKTGKQKKPSRKRSTVMQMNEMSLKP